MTESWEWKHNLTDKRYYLLSGDPDGEHLRVEIGTNELVVISHELRSVVPSVQWKDRIMFSVRPEQWLEVAKLITSKEV